MFKDLVRRSAIAVGLQVVRFPVRDSLQGHLRELFKRTGVNCVLDVGANDGDFAREVREIGFKDRLVSFEPVRSTFDKLAREARGQTNWIVHNFALGAEETEKEIHVYRGSGFNSFLPASHFGMERFGNQLESAGMETVTVRRLDQVFADCVAGMADPRVFLKMDTQGWDLEVTKGASGSLLSLVGIQTEVAARHCYQGMVGFTQAIDHYVGLGFDVSGIFPVARDTDGLRVVELDCVFVQRHLADSLRATARAVTGSPGGPAAAHSAS